MKTSGEVHVVRGSALHYFTHSARVFAFPHKPSIWTRLGGGGGGRSKVISFSFTESSIFCL